jgi:large subunit ribosomal protein L7e
LKPLDPYIAYGYLSNRAVIDLVHRHAYTSARGPRRPLNDNITIEKLLGAHGILCLNDLSHEIYSVGEHFHEANNLLCTFKLAEPTGSFEKKILNLHDEVEKKSGFIGEHIEDFLQKIA